MGCAAGGAACSSRKVGRTDLMTCNNPCGKSGAKRIRAGKKEKEKKKRIKTRRKEKKIV